MSRYRMTQGSFTLFSALAMLVLLAQPVAAQSHLPLEGQQPPTEEVAVHSGPGQFAAPLAAPYYSGLAPTAVDDSGADFTTDEDTPFTLGDVLANDSDPESDPLTVLSHDASSLLGLLTWTPIPAGSLDTTFSRSGLLTTAVSSSSDYAFAVAVQPDGKIVATGSAYHTASNSDFALARYNPDGSLDTTFSGDGLLTTAFGSGYDYARAVAVQPDGKIVAAGSAYLTASNSDFALARYNPDGSLDTTFSGDGLLTTAVGSNNDHARAMAVQPDGKIVVAGYAFNGSYDDFALARYNPDGSLDTTFSGDGLLTTAVSSNNDSVNAMAVQPDGKIMVAGYAWIDSNYDFALARYNPDGSLDTTFSSDGLLTTAFGSSYDYAYAVALQADGKIVAAGSAYTGSYNDFALARYNPDGSLDTTFSGDGLLTTAVGSSSDYAYAVAVQPDGKIVVAGYALIDSNNDFALARYNTDGSLDTTFSGDGLLTTAFGSRDDVAHAVAVQADGKIVAAGNADNGSNYDFALARYTVVDGGSFTYDPNDQFDGLANGGTAVETFSYVVSDGTLTDSATVTLTINGLNDAPVLDVLDDQVVDEQTLLSFTATATDADLPANTLSFSLDAGAPASAAIDPVTGAFSWTPNEVEGPGMYTITVRVTDGVLDDSETFSIMVNEVNNAPTAMDDSDAGFTTDEATPFTLDDVLANDSDPESDLLTVLSYDASSLLGQLIWTPTPAGSLDTSFSSDGLLTAAVGSGHDYARAVEVQVDGKIVAAGYTFNGSNYDFTLVRYNPDGSLDTTFSGDGLLTTDFGSSDGAYAVAVQADGKIVAAGFAYANPGINSNFALARYNPDGSLDTTFSGDGLLTTAFGSGYDYARAVAVQPDGKIVAAGYAANGSNYDFALVRYNPDGSLDTTFSGDGLLTTDFGSGSDHAHALTLQANGKIVAAGYAYTDSNYHFALARYNPDGSLDTTFSGDGLLTTAVVSGGDAAHAVALQADGKIVAAGYASNGSNYDFALARYNPDGSLDTTFSGDGLLTTAFGSAGDYAYAYAVALQPDGKIVAAGSADVYAYPNHSYNFALARYNPDGSLDTTFSGDGLLTTAVSSSSDYAYAVAVQPDGKIVATGYAANGSDNEFALAHYNPDGSLDTTFSGDGLLTTAIGSSSDYAQAMAVQPDGKIVVAGYTYNGGNYYFALSRYNPDGSLDTTFSGDGLLTTDIGAGGDYARAVAVQPDGKIVVAGYANTSINSNFALARYNPDGSLDTTFSSDGLLTTAVGSSYDYAYAVAVQADGKIVAAGYSYNGGEYDFALARYNPNGSLDTTFSGDGLLTTDIGGSDYARAVAVQADGKIVAAGYAYTDNNYHFALARYNRDGSRDTTFSGNGLLTTAVSSKDDYAYAVAMQADGKIVAAGSAYTGSNDDFALARYNPDGSLDTTFSSDGLLTTTVGSEDDYAYAVALEADGKIVAAGSAYTGSNDDFALARYNPDGSLDTTFSSDGLLTTAVGNHSVARAVAVQADGKIVAAGAAHNGSNYDFALARYTVVDGGSFTYDPNDQFDGLANGETAVETFSYVVSDGTLTDSATVTLTINGLNDAPVAENQATETDEDTAVAITLVASDVDGDTLSWNAGQPVHGTLTGSAPNLTYIPETNWNGTDTFTFAANDGELDSNIATVSITVNLVNDLPTADDQSVATDEDTTHEGTLTGSDIDDDDLSYAKVSDATHGVVLVDASGVFTYTPAANYNGADSFTFSVSDAHGGTDMGTVSITVGPVNDVPVPDAGVDQTGSEGQLMQFSGSYTDPGLLSIQAVSIAWDFGDGITTTGDLTPTHIYADDGVYTVTLTVDDGEGGVASDTLLVTVENVAPELAPIADQSVIINEILTLTEAYTDPGWLDTHTALVDWGDGFTDTINLAAGLTGFNFTHAFDTKGLYTVTVTITDNDGGVDQITFAVTVRKTGYNIWLPIITRH